MINRRRMLALTASAGALPFAGSAAGAAEDRAGFVDPFIGTDGTGHTFPGPSRPFGMIQPGPDNAGAGWEYTSGYQYRAPRILGFSQNRASGTGIPELGDVLLQPSAERREDLSSTYAKASEVARPGYYAVTLADNGVRVELTSSLRSAFHRYRFAGGGACGCWSICSTASPSAPTGSRCSRWPTTSAPTASKAKRSARTGPPGTWRGPPGSTGLSPPWRRCRHAPGRPHRAICWGSIWARIAPCNCASALPPPTAPGRGATAMSAVGGTSMRSPPKAAANGAHCWTGSVST
ncbi:MAG: hypothetical protein K2X68_10590, partial [Novosphingobium sp.]|nr:hypothetical protein [Novosphingobium sp.]